ncbi:hypothetical protein FOZ62_017437, partial [Perkinsus olseni]
EEMERLGIITKAADPNDQKANDKTRSRCRVFARSGACKYGQRCRYAHVKDETPADTSSSSTVAIKEADAPETTPPPAKLVNGEPGSSRKILCYTCRQEGHISRDCPSKGSVTPSDPLKAVRFDYVEPIRYFGSMSVDLVVSSPVDGARTSPLKVLLDTGAKRNYLSKALADNLRSRLHVDPVDLPSPHVSSQVDGTILRATKSLKLRTAATTPCGSDPVIQFLILDE